MSRVTRLPPLLLFGASSAASAGIFGSSLLVCGTTIVPTIDPSSLARLPASLGRPGNTFSWPRFTSAVASLAEFTGA